jgi:hypothetical protein
VETPGRQKCAKLSNAGGALQSGQNARFEVVPPLCTTARSTGEHETPGQITEDRPR